MVRDAVLARITRLSPAARTLLELASIVPTRTERWLLEKSGFSLPRLWEERITSGILSLDHTTVAFRHESRAPGCRKHAFPLRQQTLHVQVLQAVVTDGEDYTQAARMVHHALGAHDKTLATRLAPLAAKQAAAHYEMHYGLSISFLLSGELNTRWTSL